MWVSCVYVCVCVKHLNRCKTSFVCTKHFNHFNTFRLFCWNLVQQFSIQFIAGEHRGPIELCPTKLSMISLGYPGWSTGRACKFFDFFVNSYRLSPEPACRSFDQFQFLYAFRNLLLSRIVQHSELRAAAMSYLARCPVLFCMRNTFHLSNLRCYSVQVCEFPVGKLCVVSCVLMVCVCG